MKKIFFILIAVLMANIAIYAQCQRPVINSFSPVTGFIGSKVTITGANFDANTIANNIVYFGATKATVTAATFGTLEVIVPVGASTAPISVTNQCNLTAYSAVAFNGIFCPTPLTTTTYQNVAFDLNSAGMFGTYNMTAVDMDLDGKPDVVSGNGGNGITIAKNSSTPGSMSFSAYNFTSSGSTQQVYPADFDGDGKKDIATTGYVLKNTSTGPGNFGLSVGPSTNSVSGYQIAAGDFNNDGKIDLVGEQAGIMWIALNTSTGVGNFSFGARQNAGTVNTTCTGIQVADVDGDGKTDILASQGPLNRAVSIRNTTTPGSSTISMELPEFWNSGGTYPYRCQIADFDKDGKIDLTSCNYQGTTNTAIWRNTSSVGDISFATTVNKLAPVSNYRIQVGDVDGDGYPDIVVKSLGVNVFSVYRNTSTGPGVISFADRIDYTSSDRAEVSGIVIGDMDGDYVPDIATSGTSSIRIKFHRNTSATNDVTAPVASCKNIIVALRPDGTAIITAKDIDNGSSDACGIGSITASKTSFTCSDIGQNLVTLTVIDKSNNTSTCTATVTVAPAAVIVTGQTTVCAGQTVLMTANQGDSYQWQLDGTDISGATSQTYTATQTGKYSVTVTNTGGCSGTSSSVLITVNANPTVSITPAPNAYLCPNAVTLTASTSATYQWMKNGTDIVGANVQTYNATSTGTYSVKVIDLFGCSATSNGVNVSNSANEISVSGSGSYGTVFPNTAYTQNFVISNSGTGNLIVSSIDFTGTNASNWSVPGTSFPLTIAGGSSATVGVVFNGATVATYGATMSINNDDCDESSVNYTMSATITCVAPIFTTAPSNMAVDASTTSCNAAVTYTATASGTPTPSLSYSFSGATSGSGTGTGSGSTFNTGTTTVTITATNGCGSKTTTFTITVTDNTDPIASAKNVTLELDANGSATIDQAGSTIFTEAFSADASNVYYSGSSITNWNVTAGSIDLGEYIAAISGREIDLSGFTNGAIESKTSFNFTPGTYTLSFNHIRNSVDNPFTLTIGSLVNQSFNSTSTLKSEAITFTVSSSTSAKIKMVQTGTSDPAGSFIGNIKLAKPEMLLIENGSADNCGIVSLTSSQSDFDCTDVGDNTVTLTAIDANGNEGTATATVRIVDKIKPVVKTQNISINLDANGVASITTEDVDNQSYDNCTFSLALDKTSFDCSNVGANTVNLTATDASGNSASRTATVTVVDVIKPTVNINDTIYVRLPSNDNITVSASLINNGSSDICGIDTTYITPNSFDCDDIGFNTVVFTAVDNNGNTTTKNATVYVNSYFTFSYPTDTVEECDDVTITWSGGCSGWDVDLSLVSVDRWAVEKTIASNVDNSGTYSWTIPASVPAGKYLFYIQEGNNTLNWTYGPEFYIKNTPPVVLTQNISVSLDGTGSVSITPSQVDNGSHDICGIDSMTVTPSSFTCENVGDNTVTLRVKDLNGSVVTKTATVTVVDNTNPTVKTQDITIYLDANGAASITTASVNDGSYDNCKFSLALDKTSFDCSNVGANTVTLTATDASNNVSSKTATVTVVDNIKPTVKVKPATVYLDASGAGSITVSDINNGSYDNCKIASITLDNMSFTCSNTGDNTVTLTVVDVNGNSSSATSTVTVIDNTNPTVKAKNINITLDNSTGSASITTASVDNGSYDNCKFSLSLSKTSFNCGNVGDNTVTLTATDASGNVSTTTCVVTVKTTLAVNAGSDVTVYWGYVPMASATLTASPSGGSSSYSYKWSTGATTKSITVNPTSTTTYTVTVTDSKGCVVKDDVKVTVVDVRCGNKLDKVMVCHNGHTICIDANAVPAHLSNHSDDYIGDCDGRQLSDGTSPEGETEYNSHAAAQMSAYPNPFTSATTIEFTLGRTQNVSLEVYDVQGKHVATLYSGEAEQGVTNYYQLNGANLSGDVYFARLITEREVKIIKLVVVK